MRLPEGPHVPPEYVGVWKRTLLRTPAKEDTTTQVYWLQTRSWHADIRVPASRPALRDKSGLAELSRDELEALASQQGFCGTTVVDEDLCSWLRRYDFQPPNGRRDIGRMVFETPDRVLEYGVEADYFEIWERLPESKGKAAVVELSDDPFSLLLVAGEWVMSVRPRGRALPVSASLAEFLAGKSGSFVREALDFEISFGRRAPGDEWTVELSTLPWHEGTRRPMH